MTDILPYLQRIRDRFEVPEIRDSFKGFAKTLAFIFTDTNQHFALHVSEEGTATLEEAEVPKPDISITSTTDMLAAILDKKMNPMTAFATRKIKPNGAMEDLMKLQKLMF